MKSDENMKNSADSSMAAGSRGTICGHEYVDLGIGVKWATCNIGAFSPSDYGNYYAWGETGVKPAYEEKNSGTFGKDVECFAGNPSYDVARARWGDPWRMPTAEEISRLVHECTHTRTTRDGVEGFEVTGPNGNSIFLPAAGWFSGTQRLFGGMFGNYWGATPGKETSHACHIIMYNDVFDWGYDVRYGGHTVRPVSD